MSRTRKIFCGVSIMITVLTIAMLLWVWQKIPSVAVVKLNDGPTVSQQSFAMAATVKNDFDEFVLPIWVTNTVYGQLVPFSWREGAYFEVPGNNEAVIPYELAQTLFGTSEACGKTLKIENVKYTICGVYSDSESRIYLSCPPQMPFQSAELLIIPGADEPVSQLIYQVSDACGMALDGKIYDLRILRIFVMQCVYFIFLVCVMTGVVCLYLYGEKKLISVHEVDVTHVWVICKYVLKGVSAIAAAFAVAYILLILFPFQPGVQFNTLLKICSYVEQQSGGNQTIAILSILSSVLSGVLCSISLIFVKNAFLNKKLDCKIRLNT